MKDFYLELYYLENTPNFCLIISKIKKKIIQKLKKINVQ